MFMLLKWKIAHAKQVSISAIYERAKMDYSNGTTLAGSVKRNMQRAHHSAIPTPKTEQDAAAVPLSCWPQHGPDAPSTLPPFLTTQTLILVSPDTPHWHRKRMRWRSHGLARQGHENTSGGKEEMEVDVVCCCAAGSEDRRNDEAPVSSSRNEEEDPSGRRTWS